MKLVLYYITNSIFFMLVSIASFSCNAPHLNPLDPENPDKKIYQLEGFIYSYSLPRVAIQNALIIWEPEQKATLTNLSGYFNFDITQKKEGWLKVTKEGFKSDSVYVTWNSTKFFKEFFLNQIPTLDSVEFYSVLINNYPNIQNVYVTVRIKINDKDNDIDSIFIRNSTSNFLLPLIYNKQTKFYERDFTEFDFNIEDLTELIGIKFDFIAKDLSGDQHLIGSEKLIRIIKDEMTLKSPVNYDSTSAYPVLIWRKFVPGFKFTYKVEVYNDEFPPVIVWSKSGLNMESISIQVDSPLQSGNYFWVLWCTDEFLNSARSRPASFRVK